MPVPVLWGIRDTHPTTKQNRQITPHSAWACPKPKRVVSDPDPGWPVNRAKSAKLHHKNAKQKRREHHKHLKHAKPGRWASVKNFKRRRRFAIAETEREKTSPTPKTKHYRRLVGCRLSRVHHTHTHAHAHVHAHAPSKSLSPSAQ